MESIRCEVYDLAETIRDKRAEFAFSPAELDAAEARTDQLYRLKKKYGTTVEDMIAYLEQCRSELDAMETADDTLILLNGKLKKAEAVVPVSYTHLTTGPVSSLAHVSISHRRGRSWPSIGPR